MEYSYWVVNAKTLEVSVYDCIEKVNDLIHNNKHFQYYVFTHNPIEEEINYVKNDFEYIQSIKRGKNE